MEEASIPLEYASNKGSILSRLQSALQRQASHYGDERLVNKTLHDGIHHHGVLSQKTLDAFLFERCHEFALERGAFEDPSATYPISFLAVCCLLSAVLAVNLAVLS